MVEAITEVTAPDLTSRLAQNQIGTKHLTTILYQIKGLLGTSTTPANDFQHGKPSQALLEQELQ